MQKRAGLLHVYMGDGKGKTTAAVGLTVRAVGQGLPCAFLQFLKDGQSGELQPLRRLGVQILPSCTISGFLTGLSPDGRQAVRAGQDRALREGLALAHDARLLVLDEALGAVETETLSLPLLLRCLQQRPAAQEVVLTGRVCPPELAAIADYLMEMVPHRHPYASGIPARKGIEY